MGESEPSRAGARRTRCRRRAPLWLGGVAVALTAAACGGGPSTRATAGSGTTPSANAPASTNSSLTISSTNNATFGRILVSRTALYTLAPSQTACTGQCLQIWPPVLLPAGAAAATAGTGVNASLLGTVSSPGGGRQVTYAGRALYRFFQDSAGQVKGNITDQWGVWSVAVASGHAARSSSVNNSVGNSVTTAPPGTAARSGTTATSTAPKSPTTTGSSGSGSPTTTPPSPTSAPTTTGAPTTTTTRPPPTTTTTAPSSGGGAF
jgi:predicted lipoprotein with Yx(FWY)xxD motif